MGHRVTTVVPDPSRPGAVRIESTEGGSWTIAADDAAALGLGPGTPVEASVEGAVERAADAEAAMRWGLRALARRPYASTDLARRLLLKGHPAVAVDVAIERLAARGLLDDLAFARSYAETRTGRGRGPARIRRDLLAMGVSDGAVRSALDQAQAGEASVADRALELARQRAPRLAGLPRYTQRRRLLAFLTRRGFAGQAAVQAIRQVVG